MRAERRQENAGKDGCGERLMRVNDRFDFGAVMLMYEV
jgi:hypothetical protein